MKLIPLTKGYFAQVDDADFEWLSKRKWYAATSKKTKTIYAQCRVYDGRRKNGRIEGMHRLIMGITDPKILVDHGDNDGLNNRRLNLRVATKSQNGMNRGVTVRSKSGIKGVSWDVKAGKWVVFIGLMGKSIFVGYFDCKIEAGKAYDAKARELFGAFACTNF